MNRIFVFFLCIFAIFFENSIWANDQLILFEMTRGPTKIVLVGTMHNEPFNSFSPQTRSALEKIIKESNVLLVEFMGGDTDLAELLQAFKRIDAFSESKPKDESSEVLQLKNLIIKKLITEFDQNKNPNIQELIIDAVQRLKPWAAFMLGSSTVHRESAAGGMDDEIHSLFFKSRIENEDIYAIYKPLETTSQVIEAYAEEFKNSRETDISGRISLLLKRQKTFQSLSYNEYARHQAHEEILVEFPRALAKRNKNWVDRIEHYTQFGQSEGPFLMVVGLAHLFGKDGMVSLLKERGFNEKRLFETPKAEHVKPEAHNQAVLNKLEAHYENFLELVKKNQEEMERQRELHRVLLARLLTCSDPQEKLQIFEQIEEIGKTVLRMSGQKLIDENPFKP